MKIGIIGFSNYVRKAYLPFLERITGVEIAAVCDIMPESRFRELTPNALTCRYFADVNLMLKQMELNAAVISTPHTLHFEQANACLDMNVPVFVDKPLACRLHEAEFLVKKAQERGLLLCVGNQRRYEQTYDYVRQVFQGGGLGQIKLVNYLFANSPWGDYLRTWRSNSHYSGGGVLMDIGYLAIDTLNWILGAPVENVVCTMPPTRSSSVEQSALLWVWYKPSIVVNLSITYETQRPSVQEELSIFGSTGALHVRRFQAKRSQKPPKVIEIYDGGVSKETMFSQLPDPGKPLQDFLNGIIHQESISTCVLSHLRTIEIIDKAYQVAQLNAADGCGAG